MATLFKPARRTAVKLKMLISGPSGSGKSLGALRLASGIAPGRVAVIDSEHDRSQYYADLVAFDVLSLSDHRPASYIEAVDAAVDAGYEVVIIDSLSHAWLDILDRKDRQEKASPRSNSFALWRTYGAEWEKMIAHLLQSPTHLIVTARSKCAYEQVEQNGQKTVLRLGLSPQLRESTEYSFALHFDLVQSHAAKALKDNTGLFDGQAWDLCDGSVPTALRGWLATAAEIDRPEPATTVSVLEAIGRLPEAKRAPANRRWAQRLAAGVSEEEALGILASIEAMVGPAASVPEARRRAS